MSPANSPTVSTSPEPNSPHSSSNQTDSPTFISILDIQITLPLPPPSTNTYPMLTRSKIKPTLHVAIHALTTEVEPTSAKIALSNPVSHKAIQEEFWALQSNNTWILVRHSPDIPMVKNKWIFRIKCNPDGSINKYKARLVAKGFQQNARLDFFKSFSPVIKSFTICIIFYLAATDNWDIQQIDVNNVFLNGDMHEVVYMNQPTGLC